MWITSKSGFLKRCYQKIWFSHVSMVNALLLAELKYCVCHVKKIKKNQKVMFRNKGRVQKVKKRKRRLLIGFFVTYSIQVKKNREKHWSFVHEPTVHCYGIQCLTKSLLLLWSILSSFSLGDDEVITEIQSRPFFFVSMFWESACTHLATTFFLLLFLLLLF